MGKGKGKGKGNKNKLARMSEDERLRYLQHRADMEEEARRRKQQLIATFMKNKLKREDAFSRLNVAKINQEWRTILRNIKCEELKEDLKAFEKFCTESIERKNNVIQRLLCDLDESEEIYSTMLHSHLENIEQLKQLYDQRLNFFKNLYHDEKTKLLEKYNDEIITYKQKKFQIQKELECVYYGLAERTSEERKTMEENHNRKIDELKNSMLIRLEMITNDREKYMETLWRNYQNILTNYLKTTEEYRSEYIDLRQRDADDTKYIQAHYNEVANATNLITLLKMQLINTKDEHDFNLKQLSKYKVDLQKRIDSNKIKMELGLFRDKEKLKLLAVCSNSAIKNLEALTKKGKAILQMASYCCKLEGARDGTLFPIKKQLFAHTEQELKERPSDFDCFKQDTLEMASQLENFWSKYNKAKIDIACLKEEKFNLREENSKLKEKLKEYLITVNMNSSSNDDYDKKLRPSSMKVEKVVHIDLKSDAIKASKRRPVTCIEGNLSNAVRSALRPPNKPFLTFNIAQSVNNN